VGSAQVKMVSNANTERPIAIVASKHVGPSRIAKDYHEQQTVNGGRV
jgi:hypothetical protein